VVLADDINLNRRTCMAPTEFIVATAAAAALGTALGFLLYFLGKRLRSHWKRRR
jgi:hypothetical protein